MELEEVDYLVALRQLYGLLQNKSSKNLSENARLLLKDLLDNATQRVLGSQSKVIAAQSGASSTPCPSLTEPPKAMPKLNPPVSPAMLRAFPSIAQSSSKASKCQAITSQRDERPPLKPIVIEDLVSKLSNTRISSNKLHYTSKPCQFCEQTSMKLQKLDEEIKISGKKPTILNKGHNQLSPFCCVNAQAEGWRHMEEKGVESMVTSIENPTEKQKRIQISHSTKTNARVDGIAAKSVTPSITRSYSGEPVFLGGLHREYDWRCQEAYGRASGDYYVHGLRVPMDQDGLAKRPQMMMSQLSKENPLENRTSMPPQSPAEPGGHKSSKEKKLLVLQMPIKPTLLYHKPSSENRTEAKSKLLPRHHGGGSSRPYLSSPTHQQWITSSSSSLSSQTDTASTTQESNLVESSSNTPYSILSHSRERVGATPRYRSGRQRNPEKVTGRLRRFKNKLGLIFHHHHHHHHHHHNHDGDRGSSHSMWKPLQKMFHHTNTHVVHEKKKKSTVANVPRKNHVGHFNTLVGGLLKHVGHPKIQKRTGRVGNKKVAKKLKWWQMFRRHGGVKLPKRRRVKVGFMRRKPQLKMS